MSEARLSMLHQAYATTREASYRDELLEAYLPLARALAAKFTGRGAEREDLEQVAAIALLKALERFDPTRGFRFSTFAVPTVTGALRNHLRDQSGSMRVPRDVREQLYRLTRVQERFEQEHKRTPSAAELAEEMQISPDELLILLDAAQRQNTVSLDSAIGDDGESTLEAFLGQRDERFEQMERTEFTDWLLAQVTPQERQLLSLRYQQQLGQRETASRLGVSQMQVSRLERRVLTRLQAVARAQMERV